MNQNLHQWIARLRSFFRKKQTSRDVRDELAFHQAMLRERLLREGVPPVQVNFAAQQAFGNSQRWHERMSELWQFRGLESFLQDLRFALRILSQSPAFTAVAVLTLALGVGANTAVFSMINALLLRPLAVPGAAELTILSFGDGGPNPQYDFPTPYFRALEERREAFTEVFAYNPDSLQVQGSSGTESIAGVLVSGSYFQALQVPPLLGRYLTPADDQRGGGQRGLAVVISEPFWQTWFGRSTSIIGRKLVIANVPFTVVGVMPKSFRGADPTLRPDIFAPLSADPLIDAPRNHIDAGLNAWWLMVMARRKPGVSLAQANAALLTVSMPILHATGDPRTIADGEQHRFRFSAQSGAKGFTYARLQFRQPLLAMGLMCAGLLLLACINLATLLLARGAGRQRELATRMALGGSRSRLVRQLLVESLLIAFLGTAAGLSMAPAVSRPLAALLLAGNGMSGDQLFLDTTFDLRVFAFAALMAIAATVLIGLLPALRVTGGSLSEQIKKGQYPKQAQPGHRLLAHGLLASETALALLLVVGAGLLATSLTRLFRSGLGFDPHGLISVAFKMDKQPLEGDALMQRYEQIGGGLRRQPNVTDVSFQFIVPLSHRGWNGNYARPGGHPVMLDLNSVAPHYFQTMRIPLMAGREFRWNDTKASGLKIILNQKAAGLLFPGRNAVGQQIVSTDENTTYEVAAVVGDAKYRDMASPAPPAGYIPIMQDQQSKPSLSAVVRMSGPFGPLGTAARTLAREFAPTIPPPVLTTFDDAMNASMSSERMMAMLSLFFAACALLVTAIGLYGTLAYNTAKRTPEIGIRVAMGAPRSRVMAMILRENISAAGIGCGAGLILALLTSQVLASLLYSTSSRDPWVFVGSVLCLAAVVTAASILPALRAARVQPLQAIRCE